MPDSKLKEMSLQLEHLSQGIVAKSGPGVYSHCLLTNCSDFIGEMFSENKYLYISL